MTGNARSVLVTTIGRNFDDIDISALATSLGCVPRDLVTDSLVLEDVVAADPLAGDSPVLLRGIGNIDFDARAASALGIPLLLLIDAPGPHVDVTLQEASALGAVVAAAVTAAEAADVDKVKAALQVDVEPVMSAVVFETWLLKKAKGYNSHIVLPEGDDDRILQAADELLKRDICRLTILGDPEAIRARAAELGLDLSKATLSNPLTDPRAEEFAEKFTELRKSKGMTLEEARETMKDISYYATIGDCAVNPNPTAEQLGEIAVVSARTASQFGIDPRVAILSYSTGTSGFGPDVDRAAAALEMAKKLDPELHVDGPLQFDAAVDPVVAAKKMPESTVAGQANVFIFPDLDAGNIGYKTAQRTGHALAVGPILQGLNKPVNDLSRGATVADIVNTVAITAIQAGDK